MDSSAKVNVEKLDTKQRVSPVEIEELCVDELEKVGGGHGRGANHPA